MVLPITPEEYRALKNKRHAAKQAIPFFFYKPLLERSYPELGRLTICILMSRRGVILSEGISICSPADQFVKVVGRAKARGRAEQAIIRGEVWQYIRHLKLLISDPHPTINELARKVMLSYLKAKHPQVYSKLPKDHVLLCELPEGHAART